MSCDTVLRRLSSFKYLIKTDSTKCFFQIRLDKSSMPYVGTPTPKGLKSLYKSRYGNARLVRVFAKRMVSADCRRFKCRGKYCPRFTHKMVSVVGTYSGKWFDPFGAQNFHMSTLSDNTWIADTKGQNGISEADARLLVVEVKRLLSERGHEIRCRLPK